MIEEDRLTDWEEAVEYGKHLFGVYPSGDEQMVTGLLHHNGNYFESYVDSGSWKRYPNWVREYKGTPLKDALEALVEERTMHTTEVAIKDQYYPEQILESAGLSGWRFEYHRKQAFRRSILGGNTNLGVPTIINRYGDVYAPLDASEHIEEEYWSFVDENFDHRHPHHTTTKTQND